MRYSPPVLWLLYLNRRPGVQLPLIFTAFGCMFLAISILVSGLRVCDHIRGVDVNARVVNKQASILGKRGPHWKISCSFVDQAGNPQTALVSLSPADGEGLEPGDTIHVRYVPNKPKHVDLSSTYWEVYPVLLLFILVGSGIAIGGFLALAKELREVRECVRLIQTGNAVVGWVTGLVPEFCGKRNDGGTAVIYEYATTRTESNEPILYRKTQELAGKVPRGIIAGMGIVVLVDPDDPSISTPDIFDARRDDREQLFG